MFVEQFEKTAMSLGLTAKKAVGGMMQRTGKYIKKNPIKSSLAGGAAAGIAANSMMSNK